MTGNLGFMYHVHFKTIITIKTRRCVYRNVHWNVKIAQRALRKGAGNRKLIVLGIRWDNKGKFQASHGSYPDYWVSVAQSNDIFTLVSQEYFSLVSVAFAPVHSYKCVHFLSCAILESMSRTQLKTKYWSSPSSLLKLNSDSADLNACESLFRTQYVRTNCLLTRLFPWHRQYLPKSRPNLFAWILSCDNGEKL